MEHIFDFGDTKVQENNIRKTWAEFRLALVRKEFRFDDTSMALNNTFLKVFDDLHSHMSNEMMCSLSDLKTSTLLRGARIKSDEIPNYDRMLPNAKYITKDNRFSPPGNEWLYLAVGDSYDNAMACSRAECRIKNNDRFASCLFEIASKAEILKVVKLTIADSLSTKEINDCLEKAGQKYKDKIMRRSIQAGISVPPRPADVEKMQAAIKMWTFKTYMKLLSEQIFLPLDDTDDKSVMYAPFQCMAQYFISKGYAGIVYKSTVSADGKNLVLFDKTYANPVGDISIVESIT